MSAQNGLCFNRSAANSGADDGIRTRDLRFTKPLLYQLSYVGARAGKVAFGECAGKVEEVEGLKR